MRDQYKKCIKKRDIAVRELSYLIGAKIVSVEPYPNNIGYYWTDEIGEITIETVDGRKLSIQVSGDRILGDAGEYQYMEVYDIMEE